MGPYSQAKAYGELLFISGQNGFDPETGKLAGSDIEAQTLQTMKNLEAILAKANRSFNDVLKTTCFLKNMADFDKFNQIYKKYMVSLPARSCVAVAKLPGDALIEIELIAGHISE